MPLFLPDLTHVAPSLDGGVSRRAEAAYHCAAQSGRQTQTLLIADMSKPSAERRLWVFDLSDPTTPTLILRGRVAHGSGSDPRRAGVAERFSNAMDSGMTSLGLYRVAERYVGQQGRPAYALDGLDDGFNSAARPRRVVLHPSDYVGERGLVGRSLGCPAVSPQTFQRLAKLGVEDGALLWIDGPDPSLANAPSLACADGVPAPEPLVCRPSVERPWWQVAVGYSSGSTWGF
jgi:hypothetical protein